MIPPRTDPLGKLSGLISDQAEQALLGGLMLPRSPYEAVSGIINAEDFANGVHARIYAALVAELEAGKPATPITLAAALAQDTTLRDLGGAKYLVRLATDAGLFTSAQIYGYANHIADLARRRRIIIAAEETISDAAGVLPGRDSMAVLDEAEERLYHIAEHSERQPQTLGSVAARVVSQIERAYRDGVRLLDTGIADLDAIICGLSPGDLCVVAGRPGMGKSTFAGTVALNVARRQGRVAMFSLEMTAEELAGRWLAGLTHLDTQRQRTGKVSEDEWITLVEAQAELAALPITVDDQPRLSAGQIRQRARRIKRRERGLALVIIDHLQLIRQGGRQESRRLEIGDATSALKAMAKELAVPILLLSQLSRAPDQRDDRRPRLSDLRESGDIEQDADQVLFLYREEYYITRDEPRKTKYQTSTAFNEATADWLAKRDAVAGIAEIEIAKNRHGKSGSIKCRFDGKRQRFEDLWRP